MEDITYPEFERKVSNADNVTYIRKEGQNKHIVKYKGQKYRVDTSRVVVKEAQNEALFQLLND